MSAQCLYLGAFAPLIAIKQKKYARLSLTQVLNSHTGPIPMLRLISGLIEAYTEGHLAEFITLVKTSIYLHPPKNKYLGHGMIQ